MIYMWDLCIPPPMVIFNHIFIHIFCFYLVINNISYKLKSNKNIETKKIRSKKYNFSFDVITKYNFTKRRDYDKYIDNWLKHAEKYYIDCNDYYKLKSDALIIFAVTQYFYLPKLKKWMIYLIMMISEQQNKNKNKNKNINHEYPNLFINNNSIAFLLEDVTSFHLYFYRYFYQRTLEN